MSQLHSIISIVFPHFFFLNDNNTYNACMYKPSSLELEIEEAFLNYFAIVISITPKLLGQIIWSYIVPIVLSILKTDGVWSV